MPVHIHARVQLARVQVHVHAHVAIVQVQAHSLLMGGAGAAGSSYAHVLSANKYTSNIGARSEGTELALLPAGVGLAPGPLGVLRASCVLR